MILIVSTLLANEYDIKDSLKYILFQPDIRLRVTEKGGIDTSALRQLTDNLSNESIIKKTVYNGEVLEIYFNTNDILNDLSNFGLSYTGTSQSCNDFCFISTVKTEETNQIGIINDFKNNHKYNYYKIDDLGPSGSPMFGDYEIKLGNNDDLNTVQNMIDSGLIKGELVEPMIFSMNGMLNRNTEIIKNIIILIIVIFLANNIYDYYNNARKISILKMLGQKNSTIMLSVNKKNFFLFLLGVGLSSVYVLITLGQFDLQFMIKLQMFYFQLLFIQIITLIVSHFILSRTINISQTLKKQNVTDKLLLFSMFVKFLSGIMIIGLSSVVIIQISSMYTTYQENQQYEEIFNVVKFEGLGNYESFQNLGEDEYHERALEFYQEISRSGVDVVYSNFMQYHYFENKEDYFGDISMSPEGIVEETDQFYLDIGLQPEALVDKNYLIKYEVVAYTESGEKVDWSIALDSYLILVPKKEGYDPQPYLDYTFDMGYASRYKSNSPKDLEYKVLYYDAITLPVLHPDYSKTLFVDSPNMFVIDANTAPKYQEGGPLIFSSEGGVQFFAENRDEKYELFNQIEPYLIQSGMNDFYDISHFVSYGDSFGQVSNEAILKMMNQLKIIAIFILVYTVVSYQLNNLLFEYYSDDIIVKRFLGYSFLDLFNKIIIINIVCIIGISIYSIIMDRSSSVLYSLLFLSIIEMIILLTYVLIVLKGRISNVLKGDKS